MQQRQHGRSGVVSPSPPHDRLTGKPTTATTHRVRPIRRTVQRSSGTAHAATSAGAATASSSMHAHAHARHACSSRACYTSGYTRMGASGRRKRGSAAPSGRRALLVVAAAAAAAAAATVALMAPAPVAVTAGKTAVAAAKVAATGTASKGAMGLMAVVLGYACMLGSCFRSVPQIAKIIKYRSAEGLSVMSNITELLCYTVVVAYNFAHGYPFNTFGEVFACWVQDIVLVGLIFRHIHLPKPVAAASAVGFTALCAVLFRPGFVSPRLLSVLQMCTIFIMAFGSRLPQILLNIRRGDAGMMSLTTCLLNVAGNMVRIFTTLVLTKDMNIMAGAVTQGVLNSILLYQTIQTALQRKRQKLAQQQAASDPKPSAPLDAKPLAAPAAASAVAPQPAIVSTPEITPQPAAA